MSIYAIGDLHLSFSENKPMDIFGKAWENYEERLRENWSSKIKQDDLVILPGDFSWAMKLEDTEKDFEYLNSLPGKKILSKGNHDYWWKTVKSMQEYIEKCSFTNIEFLNNNAFIYENNIIVGTRGWSFTESENSEKMHNRETLRLENSIQYALALIRAKKGKKEEIKGNSNIIENGNCDDIPETIDNKNYKIICAMHYPPITKQMLEKDIKSEYISIMKKYNIQTCIYGHLHGKSHDEAVEGIIDGVNLQLVSSDYLKFNPILI